LSSPIITLHHTTDETRVVSRSTHVAEISSFQVVSNFYNTMKVETRLPNDNYVVNFLADGH
jgi:hypothetical protein